MNRQEFSQLVRRLEDYAQAHPRQYRLKVTGLLLLGYAYLILMLLLLAGLLGLLIFLLVAGRGNGGYLLIKFGIVLALPIYAILRALFVRLKPPEGIRLRPAEAPRLFALIEKLRRAIKAPRLHRVLITDEFNAAVYQHPRLGLFGWHRNYLMIGYPMLMALDPVEFEAVLAHELGHVSRAHGRLGNWIYRVRASWGRLIDSFEKNPVRGAGLFLSFFRWYIPHFHAWSLIVAREHEYEADLVSAALVGPETCARALVATRIHGAFLDKKFHEALMQRAGEGQPQPESYFGEMNQGMRGGYAARDVERWIELELSQATDIHDSHPALSDRLRGFGAEPATCAQLGTTCINPAAAEGSAAAVLLGEREPEIRRRLDGQVGARLGEVWQMQAEAGREQRLRLNELEQKSANGGGLDPSEALEHACLIARTQGAAPALPLLRECSQRADALPQAHYALGEALLELENDEGLQQVEEAIRGDAELTLSGCELAIGWLKTRGRDTETETWFARVDEHFTREQETDRERGRVTSADHFMGHELPAEIVAGVCATLANFKPISKAYLVRKVIPTSPRQPHYVVAVQIKFPMLTFQSENAHQNLIEKVCKALRFPSSYIVIHLDRACRKIENSMSQIEGALIYWR